MIFTMNTNSQFNEKKSQKFLEKWQIQQIENIKGLIQAARNVSRKRNLETVKGFLNWASGSKSNYMLQEDFLPPNEIED